MSEKPVFGQPLKVWLYPWQFWHDDPALGFFLRKQPWSETAILASVVEISSTMSYEVEPLTLPLPDEMASGTHYYAVPGSDVDKAVDEARAQWERDREARRQKAREENQDD